MLKCGNLLYLKKIDIISIKYILFNDIQESNVGIKSASSSSSDDTNITFSTKDPQILSSSNFSFTFNISENGDFIKKKNPSSQPTSSSSGDKVRESPYQLSKQAILQQPQPPPPPTTKSQAQKIDLKSINDELNQISKRAKLQQTSSELPTSTPTKLTKSVLQSTNLSEIANNTSLNNNKPKYNKSTTISSAINHPPPSSIDENSETANSGNNHHLFNQESFISSIPERAENDSTLIASSNHRLHNNNRHKRTHKNDQIDFNSKRV